MEVLGVEGVHWGKEGKEGKDTTSDFWGTHCKKWTEIYDPPPLPRASHQGNKSKQSTRSVYYSKDLEHDQYEV